MMILGIGSDLIPVSRIAQALQRHGDRFARRCFSPEECAHVESRAARLPPDQAWAVRASSYAKRWAAKEACAKALGLGIREAIYLRDIVITHDSAGKPSILLAGGALRRAQDLAPAGAEVQIDLSLSDDGGMALAFVVISAATRCH